MVLFIRFAIVLSVLRARLLLEWFQMTVLSGLRVVLPLRYDTGTPGLRKGARTEYMVPVIEDGAEIPTGQRLAQEIT
jgi:hypothetical protein